MELVINLASERIYVYSNRNGVIERIKNGSREYFDTFVRYDKSNDQNPFIIPNSTKYFNNNLLYAIDHLCSDSDSILYQKIKCIQPIPMTSSSEGQLEYQTADGPISPREVLTFLLKYILQKVRGEIKQLTLIIPDFYYQPQRCVLRDILKCLLKSSVDIRFMNHSTAGIECISKSLPSEFQRKAIVLRFGSGVFEVSLFKNVTSFSATPVCCISDPTITGVDIVSRAYTTFLQKLISKKNLEEEQDTYFQYNWMGINHFIGMEDIDDNIPGFYYTANHQKKETDYDPEFTFAAAQQLRPRILQTIKLCLDMSGFNSSDIAFVVSTGMWSSTIGIKSMVNELFPSAILKEIDDDILCKTASSFSQNVQMTGFKQCLQTCWSMRFGERNHLLLDRFTPFPCRHSTVLNLSSNPENREQVLVLNMISLDNKSSVVNKHVISQQSLEECLTVQVDVTVDQLGIVSDAVYIDMNKKVSN